VVGATDSAVIFVSKESDLKNILIFIILFTSSVVAQATPYIVVKGIVIAFDENKLTLKQPNTVVYVPRKAYPDLRKVQIGHTKIEVHITPSEMVRFNPKAFSK
jgi:hypothetical protein